MTDTPTTEQITQGIEELSLNLNKAIKGYKLETEEGKVYFISLEEYERLKKEVEDFEKAYLSTFYPEVKTSNSVVTQTSSQHMKQIRETLGLPPPSTAGPSPATLAAIAAMKDVDWEAEALHTKDRFRSMDATADTGKWQLPSVEQLDAMLAPDEEVSLKKK